VSSDPGSGPSRSRAAAAGTAATIVWAALEPLDRRLFRCDYSDVALLGKALIRSRAWPVLGLAMHMLNGALFGLAFRELDRRTRLPTRRAAFVLAMTEHVALYPLGYFVDRYHPARGERGVPPLLRNPRAFGQATLRHAVFGLVFGRLVTVPGSTDE
jgi:hypothetical protein